AVLEVAATDGAAKIPGAHQHPGARFARRRAFHGRHRDQDGRFSRAHLEPVVHAARASTKAIASRIASDVAGAFSGGLTLWSPTLEMASRIAKKTENGSSSGGSPTAFERWMLSSTLALSNRRTRKS